MKMKVLVSALAALALSGCANFLSIHRQNNITPYAAARGAEITLVDAKQRAIVSMVRGDRTVVCAEPSPDALQAIAASSSLSVKDGDERLAQIANSIAENASSIGLRTQSIQLLRDAMFRICEGYAGHAIDDDEVTMLHRRYQNLMLGLLAIEQLTGAVAASQVALTSEGSAAAGAASADLAAAQQKVKEEQDKHAGAEAEVVKAEGLLKLVVEELDVKVKEHAKAEDAEKPALAGEVKALQEKKVGKESELGLAKAKAKTQADLVREFQRAVTSAQGRLSAATKGSAQFDGKTQGRGLSDAESTRHVAEATSGIVREVISTSYLYEACFGYMDKLLRPSQGELSELARGQARQAAAFDKFMEHYNRKRIELIQRIEHPKTEPSDRNAIMTELGALESERQRFVDAERRYENLVLQDNAKRVAYSESIMQMCTEGMAAMVQRQKDEPPRPRKPRGAPREPAAPEPAVKPPPALLRPAAP